MTNKENAQGLYCVLVTGDNSRSERLAAWDAMYALTKSAKMSFAKLTGSVLDFKLLRQEIEALPEAPQIDPLDEVTAKPKSNTSGEHRGLISSMVRCQLMDTADSYAVIVERVKAKFPQANTTTRSVASVAADLRKQGVEVASRRQIKGA